MASACMPSVPRARLSTSVEPTGTSWNSVRWARPSGVGGYRTSRLASAFETVSPPTSSVRPTSAASSTSSRAGGSSRVCSPQSGYGTLPSKLLRAPERSSRFGSSLASSTSNETTARSSLSAGGGVSVALSPRHEPQRKTFPYRTTGLSQTRAALVDLRYNLRPVNKRQTERNNNYKSTISTTKSSSPFVNSSQLRNSLIETTTTTLSPISKCVSPSSMSISRSPSTVASPPIVSPNSGILTTTTQPRPIPKSERPWRQKLADAQRFREARETERAFAAGHHHNPMAVEPSDATMRLMAARSARRVISNELHQQHQQHSNNERELEKEIAALKCFVSKPGALDKNATVAKFRQTMAESQALIEQPSNTKQQISPSLSTVSASALLLRMPSLSRRSTTSVTKESLNERKSKDRPQSLIETTNGPLAHRRLSIVKETNSGNEGKTKSELSTKTTISPSTNKNSDLINKKDVCIKKKSLSPQQQPEIKQNIQTSINSTKTTKTNGEEKENKQIRTTTNLIKRKNSKEEINKNQQQKNVLIPAATTTEKKDEKEVVVKGKTKIEQIAVGKNQRPLTTPTKIDESKFNAVVQFKPQSLIRRKISENSLTEPKPVPGSWERTPREQFISQNKHLIRKAASESISHTRRIRPLARISSLRFYSISAPPTTGKRITINNKNNSDLNKIIKTNETNIIRLTGSPTTTTMKSTAKPKQQQNICSFASLDKQFANKRSFRLGVRKTIILKNTPQKVYAQLCCRSAQLIATTIKFNIVWKEQQKRANVTILSSDIRKVSQKHFRQPLLKIKTKAINQLKQITENLNENNIPVILKTSISENIKKQSEAPILKTLIKQVPPSVNNRQPIVVESVGNLGKAVGISSVSISNSTVKTQQQQNQQPIVPPVPPHRSQKQEQNQQQKEQPRKTSTTTILPLILPDKSVLEQFVQNKRDILDQLHEEAEEILSQTRDLSTCGTTTNKLLNLPLKETTTISSLPESKRNSQMLIASIMPPQEAQSLNSSYHSAIQDDLFGTNNNIPINIQQQQFNRQRKPIDLFGKTTLLTTHQFEKPKSLFEEKMQKQAFQLQEKAVRQSLNEPIEINNLNQSNLNLRRKSATNENADLAQTFVNQTQKPYQQEQRYAAYISLSGRQSTASCESGNSGDTENRQMGQMIDQARYKHNQQRNKFKEAIDYLDHIFEDFQRETDLNQQQKEEIKQTKQQQQMPQQSRLEVVVRPGNVKSAKEAFEKVAAALANERTASKIKKHQTSQQQQKQQIPSLPLSQQQPTIVLKRQQSYPLMVVQRSTQQQQFNSDRNAKIPAVIPPQSIVAENGSNKNNNNNLEEEEVSVAETIVLPSKNTSDRLDFTRNWLTNDGQSGWTESSGGGENSVPKPYSVKGGIIIQDVKDWDEHSLGSCSAEVAAINAPNERRLKQKEKQQQLILIKNQQQQKQNKQQIRQKQPPSLQQQQANNDNNIPPPQISVAAVIPAAVRPQPFRPQIGILPGGQMHKTPSIEQIRFLRAASQDCPPTNMASSIHSHEGFFNFQPGAACCLSTHSLQRIGFGGGAFHSYTPTVAQMQQKQISKQQKQQQLNYINQQQYLKGSIQSLPDSALSTAPNNNLIYLPGEVTNIYSNNNNNNYQPTYSQHLNRTTNNSDCNQQRQQQNKFISNKEKQQQIQTDHSLAIDALVAELELDTNLNSSNEKRRSFPTIQTEVNNQKVSNNNRNITNRPAFETINQERINPSKVDAMAKMFDKQTIKTKTSNPLSFTTNGDSTTNWSSRRNANQTIQQQHKQIERGPSLKTTTKFQLKETPPTPPPHSSKHLKQTTLYKQRQSPQFVKGTKAGVCSDRRYVVGNTKQQNINNNNESEQQQRFNTSNGFYDNVDQQHQCSPPLPPSNYHHFRNDDLIDCASMSSREIELPPQPPNQNNNGINNVPKTAGKRIGQLIKKLGNSVGGDKQQNGISAVSTLSLNRSAHEQLPTVRNGLGVKEEILTKSNSLSSERWRSQAMAQQQNLDSQDLDEDKSHGVGLGNRLKQTILGGMVRRRVPT